ncbi:hypothetical protein [Scytonema hofmannii]|uniref:hypothetical protein n=1 Tax=Scytonema hofmannii TaxID=34078 RepID=UPI00034C1528|nr:hypothetical protein [Scytonema hofmannii]
MEITAPNGQIIPCAKRGSVLIPISKVAVFGMGKVEFPEREELELLRADRRADQRAFSKNQTKVKRLRFLEEGPEYNYKRSQGNLKVLLNVGMVDSVDNVNEIISHLLDIGATITVDTRVRHPSRLEAPNGQMKVVSTWKILEDGTKYLTTLHFEG